MTSVLYDVPGPRARRRSLIASIVTGILLLGGLAWVIVTLASEGLFNAERWDIFRDPLGPLLSLQARAAQPAIRAGTASMRAVEGSGAEPAGT